MTEKIRCPWTYSDEINVSYHDEEWGVPIHDDRLQFEFLVLEGAQAGLSWSTILKRREGYRRVYEGFHPEKVALFNAHKVEEMLADPGIIRNRKKIESSINNARRFLEVQKEFGSFDKYLWGFVDYKPIMNHWKGSSEVPATTELSERVSRDLKKRGFSFVGSTIIYAHLQAVGLVNDHITGCFRHGEICRQLPGRGSP